MKNAICLLLAILLTLSGLCYYTYCSPTPFEDVENGSWYELPVLHCYNAGIMNGTSNTHFSPYENMSRAMLVTVLYRIEGEPDISTTSHFRDVKTNTWYTDAVNWAYQESITTGTSNTTFSPDQNISREEIVTFFYRYAGYRGYDTQTTTTLSSYTDSSQISSYAASAFKWATAKGIIAGVGNNLLSPKTTANRAQCATIIQRFTTQNTSSSNASAILPDNTVSLECYPGETFSSIMSYPSKADFGENYSIAVDVYNSLLTDQDAMSIKFEAVGTSSNINGATAEACASVLAQWENFAATFESKVLNGFSELYTNEEHYYSGIINLNLAKIRKEINIAISTANTYYDTNISIGLYNGMPEETAVELIYAWIVNNISYGNGSTKPLDVLESRVTVCDGYAKLFYFLCENANINCEYVVGCTKSSQNTTSSCPSCHAWNRVEINDTWYYIDTCWDYYLSTTLWSGRSICSSCKLRAANNSFYKV